MKAFTPWACGLMETRLCGTHLPVPLLKLPASSRLWSRRGKGSVRGKKSAQNLKAKKKIRESGKMRKKKVEEEKKKKLKRKKRKLKIKKAEKKKQEEEADKEKERKRREIMETMTKGQFTHNTQCVLKFAQCYAIMVGCK